MDDDKLLFFWGLGDLHFSNFPAWREVHAQRLAPLFSDLHELWHEERPAFCVSPGDLVETWQEVHHRLARTTLEEQLGEIPFYTGVGNHEYYDLSGERVAPMAETYTKVWQRPLRYTWVVGEVACIMLDYPDPRTLAEATQVYLSQETLAFLDDSLNAHSERLALIFLHCPLRNTVLDRDPERYLDYNSRQSFFSPENSSEMRAVLAKHRNASLCFSGHTHSGWEAPHLVLTEQLGDHPITHVNLMSPWYTGTRKGPKFNLDHTSVQYIADEPNVLPSFAIRLYRDHAEIRVRDHLTRRWLKEWSVPIAPYK